MVTSGFGDRVRVRRVAARLTQAELAERAGISERAVSDIERGLRRRVYPVTAAALADALVIDPDDRPAFEAAARARPAPVTDRPDHADDWRGIRRTPMVGRHQELAALLTALHPADDRLFTITGTGGIGKTRLAAEVCASLEAAEPGRVVWVSLAGLRDPDLLLDTLAAAVGVAATTDGVGPALARALTGRGLLLVLDTFEPVLAAAPDVAALLDRTTELRLIVTSRAPLRLRGERELPLPPLAEGPAAELFVHRVTAARPGLAVDDPRTMTAVADICDRLSGLPLALELAAAKVRHMSLPALSAALARPLRVLTGGERDLPERQQTMRATIGWSHDLLPPPDRVVFRRLAYFAGGWSLDAAQTICAADDEPILAALGRLCEHGLVQTADTPLARWQLLDPIGEFAAEQLRDSPDGVGVAERHAAYYTELAEAAAPRLLGPDQAGCREQLRGEVGNLRVALAWATATGAVNIALRLAGALWMFWRMNGSFTEGRSWLGRALALGGADDSAHRPTALWGAAWLAYQQGDRQAAAEFGAELLARSTADGEQLGLRNALTILGHVAMAEERFDDAEPLLERALDIARANGMGWHLATSLLNLGTAVLHRGDPRRAEQLLADAVEAHTALGDRHFTARSLIELGYALLVSSHLDRAGNAFADALRAFLDLRERWGVAEALAGLAVLAAVRGEPETAAVLTGAGQAAYHEIATQVIAPDAALAAPYLRRARESLGESRWKRAVDHGERMAIEDSAKLALLQFGGHRDPAERCERAW